MPSRFDQPVDLADRAGDPVAKRVMGLAQPRKFLGRLGRRGDGGGAGGGGFDTRQGLFDPLKGVEGALVGHESEE